MAENSLESIPKYLEESLHPQNAKAAEARLKAIENQLGFSVNLLNVVESSNLPASTRLAGAVFFKNLVKRKWVNEDGEYLLPANDVQHIKSELLNVMIKLPGQLQVQIGEAISLIAESDFPQSWPNLIDELVTKLSPENFVQNKSILMVAHSIFKRWRPLFRSDELFLEIKLVLDKFTQPFMALLTKADELMTEALSKQDKASLLIYSENFLLLVQIYYDFNCQDIPEFFEDNMVIGMGIMHKYLSLDTPLLTDPENDEEVDVLIKIKTAIIELVLLYVTRYGDVFEPLIENFITTIWNLINTSVTKQQKFDLLVVKALLFLNSVAKMPQYQSIFNNENALREIIEKIILPNVAFREIDEEMFEDEPVNFVRSDLEGSDFDSRRKAATDFLRELKEVNTELLTNIVMAYVNQFLSNSESNWRNKDLAIYLFSSLATKGSVTNVGVASTNVLVDVVKFFSENIATDLTSQTVTNPVLKTDAVKYILTFRNQLTKDQLLTTIPLLVKHLEDSNPVVYTYTAITIEKLLSMTSFADSSHKLIFNKSDIEPHVHELLNNLFNLILANDLISPEKLAENEFIVKCIMRVLSTIEDALPTMLKFSIIDQLLQILQKIAKNPSNPRFSHYVFESIGLLIKYSRSEEDVIQKLVGSLVASLMEILGSDVQEFVPYTFQILAYLLEVYPNNKPLPSEYKQLIKPVLSPAAWEFRGNIPGITRLLIAILEQDASSFFDGDQSLAPLLGVFQKLIASKANDSYGFDLLVGIFINIPFNLLSPYLKQIAILLLTRLKSSRTEKYLKKFVVFICSMSCIPLNESLNTKCQSMLNANFIIEFIDSVQPGLFSQIFSSFIVPSSSSFVNLQDKKLVTLGLLMILVSEQFGSKYTNLIIPTIEKLAKNINSYQGIQKPVSIAANSSILELSSSVVPVNDLDLESSAFGSQYSKLISIQAEQFDPIAQVKSNDTQTIKMGVVSNIKKLQPSGALDQISQEAKQYLDQC